MAGTEFAPGVRIHKRFMVGSRWRAPTGAAWTVVTEYDYYVKLELVEGIRLTKSKRALDVDPAWTSIID